MEINRHNYGEYLMLMLDDELAPAEKIQVEAYMLLNEDAANEWKMLQKTKLRAKAAPVYPRIAMLLKDEEVETAVMAKMPAVNVVSLPSANKFSKERLMYWSAAASIAAIIALFALLNFNGNETNSVALKNNIEKTAAENKTHISTAEKMPSANENIHIGRIEKMLPADNKNIKKSNPEAFSGNRTYVNNKIKNTNMPEIKPAAGGFKEQLLTKIEVPVFNAENNDKTKAKLVRKVNRLMAADLRADWKKVETNALAAEEAENNNSLVASLINYFSDNLHVEKKTINEDSFYAVTLETQNVHISKTFQSNF